MNRALSYFQELASVEPSFEAADEWRGSFGIDGQRAQLAVEPGGWLSASVSVIGSPEYLLRQQAEILAPAKIASGLTLRAEAPVERKIAESFVAVRAALEHGLAVITGKGETNISENDQGREAEALLAERLAAGYGEWLRRENGFLLQVETGRFEQKVVIEVDRDHVFFRADLARMRKPEPVSLAALVHFLLALNAQLRFARGLLSPDRVALEVVLAAGDLTPRLIDKAVGALAAGAGMARRECAALLDAEVAQAYCGFHEERR
jgi:hypothetical protein